MSDEDFDEDYIGFETGRNWLFEAALMVFTEDILANANRAFMLRFIHAYCHAAESGEEIPRHWTEFLAERLREAALAEIDEHNDRTADVTKAMRLDGNISNKTESRYYLMANTLHFLLREEICKNENKAKPKVAKYFKVSEKTVYRSYNHYSQEQLDYWYEMIHAYWGNPCQYWGPHVSPEDVLSIMDLWRLPKSDEFPMVGPLATRSLWLNSRTE